MQREPIGSWTKSPSRSGTLKAVAAEEFQAWKLTVKPDSAATHACEDGNDKVVFSKAIEFTDFPP
jgi:hypothetical protein